MAGFSLIQGTPGWGSRSFFGQGAILDGFLYVYGGRGASGTYQDCWRSADGITWSQRGTTGNFLPFSLGRSNHASIAFDGLLWAFGGTNGVGSVAQDVWVSGSGVTWTSFANPVGWSKGALPAACIHNGLLYLSGGVGFNYNAGGSKGVWSLAPGAGSWVTRRSEAASGGWDGRCDHAMFSLGGLLWVVGGDNFASGNLTDIWSSPDGSTWTLRGSHANCGPRSISTGTECYMFSKANGALYRTTDGVTWSAVSLLPASPGHQHPGIQFLNGSMYYFGGDNGGYFDDVYLIDSLIPSRSSLFPGSTAKPSHARILRGFRSPTQAQSFHDLMKGAV